MKWFWRILGALALVLLAAFFILRVPDTDPAEMQAKYGAAPSRMLAVGDGRQVHVRDEGPRDAPAIVLLHGSNADLHTWQAWTDALSADYRVVRFDQRGHGLTGPAADADYSIEAFAGDIDAVVDALGVERFVLAGNSMGGAIAIRRSCLSSRPSKASSTASFSCTWDLCPSSGAPSWRQPPEKLITAWWSVVNTISLRACFNPYRPLALIFRTSPGAEYLL